MSCKINGIDAPATCSECWFRSEPELMGIPSSPGLYRYISRCSRSPIEIEDPWRDISWQLEHKEEWCPIEQVND